MKKDKGVEDAEHAILKAVIDLKNETVEEISDLIEDENKCFMLDL
jgi:hypothetical protein